MGRGRAKAKQTKVARELKYHTPNTDLDALARELGGGRSEAGDANYSHEPDGVDEYDEGDPYAQYDEGSSRRAANNR